MNYDELLKGELVCLEVLDPQPMASLICRWNLDSEFVRLFGDEPPRLWPVRYAQEGFENHLAELYLFAIRTLDDPRTIGILDLSEIDRISHNAWISIGIGERDQWGKGYGTDAMRVGIRFGFEQLNLHRISLTVFEYNPRARRSYEKLGFKEEGRARKFLNRDGQRWDMIYMGLLHDEWIGQEAP